MYKFNRKYVDIIAIFIVVLVAMMYRRYDAFAKPQLWAESGTVILHEWETFHLHSIFIIYMGYLATLPRIIAALIGSCSINFLYIPLVYNLSAFLVTFLVAVGLWHSACRMNVRHRVLYATLFVLLPVANELFMDEGCVPWLTGIYLVNYLFAWDNKINEQHYFLTLILLLIFSTSGPFAAVLSPVIAIMIVVNIKETSLKRLAPLLVILAGGITQLICLKFIQAEAFSVRIDSWGGIEKDHFHLLMLFTKNISELLYFNDGILSGMPGYLQTGISLLVLVGFALFFVISYRGIANNKKYILLLVAVIFFVSFIITYWPKESKILSLEIARYYFIPYTCIGWLLIMAWDDKIKTGHIAIYITFLLLHSRFIKTSLPDKKWGEQIKEYYKGERDTININPDGWKVILPKRQK